MSRTSLARRHQQQGFAARRQQMRQPDVVTLPPPVGGLNARDAWSDMDPHDAILLDNWYPDHGKVTVRGGSRLHAEIKQGGTAISQPVETLAELHTGTTRKLIAAAGGGLWDVTAGGEITSPIGGSSPFSSDRWQTANMNGLLALCNGTNTPQTWDGTTKFAMPLSGAGLNPFNLVGVHVFKSRSYFWEADSQDFWVSEINSLGGALTVFPLADVAKGGGHLVAMESWTRDGGDGVDDIAVFIMSSGDIIIYQGSNPNDVDDWFLVGVFKIGSPVGARSVVKVGSDLLIVTADGYTLLSKALANIRGSRGTQISDKIVGAAIHQVRESGALFGWQPFLYPRGRRLLVNHPVGGRFYQHVVNLSTGGWCRFRGMEASSWSLYADAPYYGGPTGKVYEADNGASDDGVAIMADARQAFSYLGSRGRNKLVQLVGPLFESIGEVRARIGLASDFNPNPQANVDVNFGTAAAIGTRWDTARWDTFKWGATSKAVQGWIAHSARGYAISPSVRVEQRDARISWNGTRLSFTREGVI